MTEVVFIEAQIFFRGRHTVYSGPGYDLYFTLKYIAGYHVRQYRAVGASSSTQYEIWSPSQAEVKAQHEIDALLRPVLPELQLLEERAGIEAKLFGNYAGSSF